MNPKKKIAIYSGEIPSTTFVERLIKGLSHKNIAVHLFGNIKKKTTYEGSIFVNGYKRGRLEKGLYLLKYTLLLYCFQNKKKKQLDTILVAQKRNKLYDKVKYYPVLWHHPDIFHVQWAKGLDQWMWVKDFGIKLVLSLRGAHINYSPIADSDLADMYRRNFPKVNAFHAVSKKIAKEAMKYGAADEKIKVVYSGLDLSQFNKTDITDLTVFNIISVGRPHWIKGYVYAIDACKILKSNNIEFTYTIIGGASLELIYQIKDLDLSNNVTIMDQIPFVKVQELIQKSDLLLLPSNEEGVANVVLEAMALGTPVLSTNCGGMEEVLRDSQNGFVVPIRNAEKMADKLIEISKLSKEQRKEITNNALNTIQEQHLESKMLEEMFELYESIYV